MVKDVFTSSFLSFKQGLARIVGGIVSDPVEVEDILQEAYIKSLQASKIQKIKSPKAYLAQTAKNLALNYVDRSAVKYNVSTEENDTPPVYSNTPPIEEQVESEKRFKHFCEAVQELPVQCRRVFVLRQVYGLSQKEIARQLGLSEKTVEYHVGKGLFHCRKYMDSVDAPETAPVIALKQQKSG